MIHVSLYVVYCMFRFGSGQMQWPWAAGSAAGIYLYGSVMATKRLTTGCATSRTDN